MNLAMKTYGEVEMKIYLILGLDGELISFTLRLLYPRYHLDNRLNRSQKRSGRVVEVRSFLPFAMSKELIVACLSRRS